MITRQPIINLLRRFFGGATEAGAWYCGDAGGGAVIVGAGGATWAGGSGALVGATSCVPQLRQKLSPGAAGVPHFGHNVALRVGSLI